MTHNSVTFLISFRGESRQVTWPLDSTIATLKQHIEEETGLAADLQKLMYKGMLRDDATLSESKIRPNVKIMLIGSTGDDIKKVMDGDKRIHARAAFQKSSSRLSSRPTKSIQTVSPYTFHRVEPLRQFADPDKALALLHRLKDDWGIKQIMKEHKFSVGLLTELSPAQYTILGLNKNKGEAIELRLRTNDLSGFRDYKSIRSVLLHELTHNVHGPHDANFHALNRQLEKEMKAHQGHSMALGNSYYQPTEIDEGDYKGGAYKLGGSSSSASPLGSAAEQREIIASARLLRLTPQEIEMSEGCGSAETVPKGMSATVTQQKPEPSSSTGQDQTTK